MSQGQKITLKKAENLARRVVAALEPACERIEISGSVRRQMTLVSDIELVAIPRYEPAPGAIRDMMTGEWSSMVSRLDNVIKALVVEKPHLSLELNGDKQKKLIVTYAEGQQIGIDIFLCQPETWGYIFALRTGPSEFNKRFLVTNEDKGGFLPSEFRCLGGRLWRNGRFYPTPTEDDLFKVLGFDKAPSPGERTVNYFEAQRRKRLAMVEVVLAA